jgi:hypothetical protein
VDKKTLEQIKEAINNLQSETSVKVKLPKAPILLTIDDVCPHIPLKTLRQVTTSNGDLIQMLGLTQDPVIFDETFVKWYFSSSRWETAKSHGSSLDVDALLQVMPTGTVSNRAHHVCVWAPIIRAFERNVGHATMVGNKIVTIVSGDTDALTCIDLQKKSFACTCSGFNSDDEDERKRHALCKHLLRSVYHHYEAIFSVLEPTTNLNPWTTSLSTIEQYPLEADRKVLITNWLYYFVRRAFTKLELHLARFEDLEAATQAINALTLGTHEK